MVKKTSWVTKLNYMLKVIVLLCSGRKILMEKWNVWCQGGLSANQQLILGAQVSLLNMDVKNVQFIPPFQHIFILLPSQVYVVCLKSRSKLKMFVWKLFMRGWKMPKFLHFKSSWLRGSFSWTLIESWKIVAKKWPEMLKV